MDCCKSFLYLKKVVNGVHIFAFVPARCKSWSCSYCRSVKSNIVRNYIKKNFTSDNLYLLTLTFYHSGGVENCWSKLGLTWNRMRTYIAKKYGAFSYIRIVEPHKKGGWPHLHVLIDGCVIDTDVLRMVTKWGYGWNCHVEHIDPGHAARYMSKYLTKNWPDNQSDILRSTSKSRIVSVSRGLPAVFTVKSEWEVVGYDFPADIALFMCNALIKLLKDHKATRILSRPFAEGFIIESDIDLKDSWLEHFSDPYIWKLTTSYNYSYLPYGLQMEFIN